MKNYMAIDQHGQTFHNLGEYPRKELLHRLCRSHAGKMYVDHNGLPHHIGYIIAGLWLRLYKVEPYYGKEQGYV